jgi:hypothetical protein
MVIKGSGCRTCGGGEATVKWKNECGDKTHAYGGIGTLPPFETFSVDKDGLGNDRHDPGRLRMRGCAVVRVRLGGRDAKV